MGEDFKRIVTYMSPTILAAFGIGWLIGAEASWYWGMVVCVIAALWQSSRNSRGIKPPPTGSVIDPNHEKS